MCSNISCHNHVGFNNTWSSTLSDKPTFVEVCENFVKKESMAQLTLREDSLGVGGNAMDLNTSRTHARVNKRKDMRALCKDFHNMRPKDYLHSKVNSFCTD